MEKNNIFELLVKNYFLEFSTKKIEFNTYKFIPNENKNQILDFLISEMYYLIEGNKIIWKKKLYRYVGNIRELNKSEVNIFIESTSFDWNKNYFIMPADGNGCLIFINEEGSFYVIEKKENI